MILDFQLEHEFRGPLRAEGNWFTDERRRRAVEALGSAVGALWRDPASFARAYGLAIEFMPRSELRRRSRSSEDVIGLAILDESLIVIANDLDATNELQTLTHELAHHLLPIACDASGVGEAAACAFASGWMSASLRQWHGIT